MLCTSIPQWKNCSKSFFACFFDFVEGDTFIFEFDCFFFGGFAEDLDVLDWGFHFEKNTSIRFFVQSVHVDVIAEFKADLVSKTCTADF